MHIHAHSTKISNKLFQWPPAILIALFTSSSSQHVPGILPSRHSRAKSQGYETFTWILI